jgi:hypothetical protein
MTGQRALLVSGLRAVVPMVSDFTCLSQPEHPAYPAGRTGDVNESEASMASTPESPCVAVIFKSRRTPGDNGCGDMATAMFAVAHEHPGYLGVDSVREDENHRMTVSL